MFTQKELGLLDPGIITCYRDIRDSMILHAGDDCIVLGPLVFSVPAICHLHSVRDDHGLTSARRTMYE